MAKDFAIEILVSGFLEHPAAVAWREFAPECAQPRSVAVLKKRGHSRVYRLEGAGPGGAAVIAKRCGPAGAEIERAIYADILPALPVSALRLYGRLLDDREREDDRSCWLFLEDAGDEKYSFLVDEHRALAGQWLGAIHASAALLRPPTCLPELGPGHYRRVLRCVADAIHRNLANPALSAADVWTLEAILAQYAVLESHWGEIATFCDRMPRTLVHGDLAAKNARIRISRGGPSLVIMDWETAGWGVPAIDLWSFNPDMDAYLNVAEACWPDAASVGRIVVIGKIFRLIAAASWEIGSLAGPWVERSMRNMKSYCAAMADAIREAGWGS